MALYILAIVAYLLSIFPPLTWEAGKDAKILFWKAEKFLVKPEVRRK